MNNRLGLLGAALLSICMGCGATDSALSDFGGAGSPTASPGDADFSSSLPSQVSTPIAPPSEEEVANPFVDTSKDPFSTFGADVDTASYDYFRQTVSLYGELPPPAYVRIEDFVNFFAYDYAQPAFDADETFAIELAAAPHPVGRATTLVRVGIQAKAPPPQEKKPANLVFLVDTSGSMQDGLKLPLVKRVLKESLSTLAASDRVSLVSYAGDVAVRLAPTPVSQRAAIESAIEGLTSSGGTAGASGIHLAYEQAQAAFIEGGINHVILCTDGDFNIGVSSDQELVKLIKSKRATGITLTALGFGHDNLNDGMMEAVSNAGNGMYSVVFSEAQAVEYASERLLSTLVHVAKDMKIQVEWNPALVYAYRLLGYENRAVADDDFRDDAVDGGEVGAGHRVTALYEIVLAGGALPAAASAPALSPGEISDLAPEVRADELVRVKVRSKLPGDSDATPAVETVRALTSAELSQLADQADPDLRWAAAVASFAEILRKSPYASQAELDRIAALLTSLQGSDGDRKEFTALFTQARALLTQPSH